MLSLPSHDALDIIITAATGVAGIAALLIGYLRRQER
jgi:hypothetical protein